MAGSILWFVAWFVGYGLVTRNDKATLLRLILQGAGLAYGIGFMLSGLQQGMALLLFLPFHVPAAVSVVVYAELTLWVTAFLGFLVAEAGLVVRRDWLRPGLAVSVTGLLAARHATTLGGWTGRAG